MAQEQFQSRHGLPNSSSDFGDSDAGLSQNRAVQNRYYLSYLTTQTRSFNEKFSKSHLGMFEVLAPFFTNATCYLHDCMYWLLLMSKCIL
jgi:hypothetical protein